MWLRRDWLLFKQLSAQLVSSRTAQEGGCPCAYRELARWTIRFPGSLSVPRKAQGPLRVPRGDSPRWFSPVLYAYRAGQGVLRRVPRREDFNYVLFFVVWFSYVCSVFVSCYHMDQFLICQAYKFALIMFRSPTFVDKTRVFKINTLRLTYITFFKVLCT